MFGREQVQKIKVLLCTGKKQHSAESLIALLTRKWVRCAISVHRKQWPKEGGTLIHIHSFQLWKTRTVMRDHLLAREMSEVLANRNYGTYSTRKETARKGSKGTVCNMRVRLKNKYIY